MSKVNALLVDVYRSPSLGDCTNNGITSKYDTLYLMCDEGPFEVDTDDPRLLKIGKVEFLGKVSYHARPFNDNGIWFMNGGNFVYDSDSRFRRMTGFYGALPVHDRQESEGGFYD